MFMKFSKGHKVSSSAAVVAILCFFLPWVFVSCGAQPVGSFSGWDIATGPTAGAGYTAQRVQGDPSIFLVLLAGIGVLALAYLAYKRGKLTALDGIGLIGFGAVPLLVMVFRYSSFQSQAAQQGIRIDPQLGLWGVVLGYLCVIAGGVMNYKEPKS